MRTIKTSIYILLLLFAVPSLNAQQKKTGKCLDCHAKLNAKKYLHGNLSESCNSCHVSNGKPHPAEDVEGFTLVDKSPALCNKCHIPAPAASTQHRPFKRGGCMACHEMHSSANKGLISAPATELCFSCHGPLSQRVDTAVTAHSILRKDAACMNCHTPHQSAQPKLLITAEKDLCLTCHNKTIRKDSVNIRNIGKELETNRFIHGAITKNGCSGCHDPHASGEASLLRSKFQTSTYVIAKGTKENVALCFNCHDPLLLDAKKTTTGTSFRDGELNLHNKHVAKFKGRNCVDCHAVHSSPNQFLLVDKIKFGQWDMPMKFTRTETGGSCITACHAPKTYSRVVK
jgi:predicted CXXCH cytochrome family protein